MASSHQIEVIKFTDCVNDTGFMVLSRIETVLRPYHRHGSVVSGCGVPKEPTLAVDSGNASNHRGGNNQTEWLTGNGWIPTKVPVCGGDLRA
eukprot:4924015-Amphidinium_carterae.1